MHYSVNDKGFQSYLEAVAAAKTVDADVIETATGKRRWTPPTVGPRAEHHYKERKAAYEAQERMLARKK